MNSIATHGIVSSRQAANLGVCLTSLDSGGSDRFSCTGVNLKCDPKTTTHGSTALSDILTFATEDRYGGIFIIPIERHEQFIVNNLTKRGAVDLIEDRIRCSVVFLFNHPDLHYSFKDTTCWEQRCNDPLPPNAIQAILAPSEYVSYVKTAFPNVPIIPINSTVQTTLPLSQKVRASLSDFKDSQYPFTTPDYVQGIKDYVERFKPDRFMIHITRLALEHDISQFLLPNSPWGARITPAGKRAMFAKAFSSAPNPTPLTRSHSAGTLTIYHREKKEMPTLTELLSTSEVPQPRKHSKSFSL